ncbi:polysaccharide deacetylase family protein [Schlesneria paludicola]|uniref:hypothetical protein n=1 Tax=Schlesneria paludicola TaxID=360056 RepID=UPI00029B1DFE|nr:hypothetical protein [Schlesneria paludicola]
MPANLPIALRSAKPAMLVVVHDFSSVFLSELGEIVDGLVPLVGRQITAAIVPRWRGSRACLHNPAYRELLTRCSEHLLHGWTHQSAARLRPVSLLTDSADEFRGLDESTILERLEFAQADFREQTGQRAQGLLPPAWQLPIAASRISSLKFVVRFDRLESCERGVIAPLATWSWDWGQIGCLGYGGECLGHLMRRVRRASIPCIAIHPVDVRRGYFVRALRLIESFVRSGYRPMTASEILSHAEGAS